MELDRHRGPGDSPHASKNPGSADPLIPSRLIKLEDVIFITVLNGPYLYGATTRKGYEFYKIGKRCGKKKKK